MEEKIIEQNMNNIEDTFFFSLKESLANNSTSNFAAMTVFGILIEQEILIISSEWKASMGQPNIYYDTEKEKQRYAKMRYELEKVENWKAAYDQSKISHNECERENLDDSDGSLYAFVLPEFHSDGTFEPWGERDVPWNISEDL